MPAYSDMPFNYTNNDVAAKSVVIKTSGNEKVQVTVMLTELADSMTLPLCVIVNQKN
jgi:hypothetical protein